VGARVGMKAKLTAEEDQTPIDGEAMQADMKGSMRKLKKVLTHCRKAGNLFKHSIKAKVYHPPYSQDHSVHEEACEVV